ncbi:MAG: acyl-CoA dehydrogenase [Alphaproteobacteria bacterium]|nr:acyl-CoA dehydrogenase [Alphaproteobacteria bacterium]
MDGNFAQFQAAEEDTGATGVDGAFRAEVAAFLDEALTDELRAAGRATTGLKSSPEACRIWREKLYDKGWVAPSWPVEHGGTGWSTEQRLYFENACAEHDAPELKSSGIRTIGPLIIAKGSPAQQAHYLPAILKGEHEWCQGFSEPRAGSDLSALGLKAERDGDEFVLTGSKVWTSFAQYATHMFLLARSDAGSSRTRGLVFLLVRMDTPGINVRPIRFIDGEYETNEVFFDGARVPVTDRIGEIDDGWSVAKHLMAIARSNNTTTGQLRRALRAVKRGAAAQDSADAMMHIGDLERQVDAFEALEAQVGSGRFVLDDAPASSVLKLRATELLQAITEVGLDLAPHSDFSKAKYFATRAATIYSGTSEVHRNILARAIGCP